MHKLIKNKLFHCASAQESAYIRSLWANYINHLKNAVGYPLMSVCRDIPIQQNKTHLRRNLF